MRSFTLNDEKVQLKQFSWGRGEQLNDNVSKLLNANKNSRLRDFPVSISEMGQNNSSISITIKTST